MSLPEQLPRAKPTDEGPFLIEVHPHWRSGRGRWWRPGAAGYTSILDHAGRYDGDYIRLGGYFDDADHYAVCLPVSSFDLTTRLGRVQAAWWLRDRGAALDIWPQAERAAYVDALDGDDACDVAELAALVDRYKEAP